MGGLPERCNEPPEMRQETASGRAGKVSLLSHPDVPLWGTQPARKARTETKGRGLSRPGRKPWTAGQLRKAWTCARLTSSSARALPN